MQFSSALAELLPDGTVRYRKVILNRQGCRKGAVCALTGSRIRPLAQAWRPTWLIRENGRLALTQARDVWYSDAAVIGILGGIGSGEKEILNLMHAFSALEQDRAEKCQTTIKSLAAAAHAAASAPITHPTARRNRARTTPSRQFRRSSAARPYGSS